MDEIALLAEERLFTRDLEGHLLRMDRPTFEMLDDSWVTVTIDGRDVRMPLAVPLTDPEGGIRYDEQGRPIPRLTTILDAVAELYGSDPGPVPVLCYREHMTPVAVCRVCLVQVAKREKDGCVGRPDPKLVPACHQPVVEGMVVETMASRQIREGREEMTAGAKRVRKTVRLLVELLSADHLHRGAHPANELEKLAERLEVEEARSSSTTSRFPRHEEFGRPGEPGAACSAPPAGRMNDDSSPWFIIDRTACILCDRCVRGCGEVRGHQVLARAGKGSEARIAFDWGDAMGESSCVRCGECFISCPTDAITMRPGVKPSPWDFEERDGDDVKDISYLGWIGRFLRAREVRR
jgi:predicted molibdopterin-dependent oxidoreductase YjgC